MAHGKLLALLKRPWVWVLLVAVALYYVLECRGYRSIFYTPGDRFRAVMAKRAAECAKHGPRPETTNREVQLAWQAQEERCALLKVQVEDWQATPEGRFAHSIKIPNPVPEDSGYRWWMRPWDYFKHLCEREAGEFIFKAVDGVEGIIQLRPRDTGMTEADWMGSKYRHLFAMEDPYGHMHEEVAEPGAHLVGGQLYAYLELPAGSVRLPESWRSTAHASQFERPNPDDVIERHYRDGQGLTGLRKEFDTQRRARYGFTWRGIKRPHDREMGIAGGELIVLDLETNEVLAVRRGYALYAGQWQTTPVCPRYGYWGGWDKGTAFTAWFLLKVLRTPQWKEWFADAEKTRRVRETGVGPVIR